MGYVYGIIDQSGRLLYVGRAANFQRRREQHLTNIATGRVPPRFRAAIKKNEVSFVLLYVGRQWRQVERGLIALLTPRANSVLFQKDRRLLKRLGYC